MKNFIVVWSILVLSSNFGWSQNTPSELANMFTDALIKNDTNTIFSFYPSYQDVITYAHNQGIPLPPDEEMPAIAERAAQAFIEFKYQIKLLRSEIEQEGYDWDEIEIGEILIEEQEESIVDEEEGEHDETFLYYAISITFQQADESFNLFFGAFDVETVYKIAMEVESDL